MYLTGQEDKLMQNTFIKHMGILGLILFVLAAASGYAGGSTEEYNTVKIEEQFDFEEGRVIEIDLKVGGKIKVTGWDKEEVHLIAEKYGRDWDSCSFSLDKTARGLKIEAEMPFTGRNTKCGVNIILFVPEKTGLSLNTMGGEITLSGLTGDIEGTTMGGEIVLTHLEGKAKLTTMGGSIHVSSSNLSGFVKTMGGDIILEEVEGDLDTSTMGGKVIYNNSSLTKADMFLHNYVFVFLLVQLL